MAFLESEKQKQERMLRNPSLADDRKSNERMNEDPRTPTDQQRGNENIAGFISIQNKINRTEDRPRMPPRAHLHSQTLDATNNPHYIKTSLREPGSGTLPLA